MSAPSEANANPNERKEGQPVPQDPKAQELESALQKLSEEKPRFLQEMMAMGFSSVGNPLHQKMTSEHITQVLTLATAHDERQYNLTKQTNDNEAIQKTSSRRYFFAGFVLICAITVIILILFQNQPQVLIPALTGLGGFVSGAAAGFGLGKQKG